MRKPKQRVDTSDFSINGKKFWLEGDVLRCRQTGTRISLERAKEALVSLDHSFARRAKEVHEERMRLTDFLETWRTERDK